MTKTVRFGVFIGRFQPFHNGHAYVVKQALEKVDHLILLIGSANRARNTRNPFTYDERVQMITNTFHWEVQTGKIVFAAVEDVPSNDRWEANVRRVVAQAITSLGPVIVGHAREIYLCGQEKDATSFYVNKFPEWEPIGIRADNHMISATDFRNSYFARLPMIIEPHLPKGTIDFLKAFHTTPQFKWLLQYNEAKRKRDEMWAGAPFPPKDVCADAVVVQSGHVLLVTRGKFPGKGLLALPGGHVEVEQTVREAAVAELKQETKIADRYGEVPAGRLDSFITAEKRFDDPYRSDFGRVITHAFLFRLPEAKPLWKVKGSDDADLAKWYRIADLRPDQFHDDHYYIIEELLGL